ncbi:MAG TPA: pantetheine-phosphate adenylyltransferase [Nitrospirae bacterium]|nr:phosphopantetheine adenylyltransferase [bacterium BMS3Abin09]GBE40752.1 phosphopantetheine adenylyltransferase [bacterium BMS3Bbin09]HDH34253.1 pantetheine-phosphate adenylyltransferase [Nitrospirota bacterium]HDN95226.1 pantetheine-phosphate adenylyltransferase [Nitrospirota bacterium]HDO67439.1 pantetheine-phosphate adenylyltransferase [Nitrospirota bacterium]
MSKVAIYPGTFDPITNGHIDIITRSLRIFDEVIVAVAPSKKKEPFFTVAERIKLIEQSISKLKGARAASFDNLLMNYAEETGSIAVVRGLRAVSDFEYELQMALMNRRLNANIETVFMMPDQEYIFLSSTIVKEVLSFGGSVKGLVPQAVEKAINKKIYR